MTLMIKFIKYLFERFHPLTTVFLFIPLYFLIYYFIQISVTGEVNIVLSAQSITGAVTFYLVFFHIRLLDDIKDFEKDSLCYPDRLLSRGIISLKNLRYWIIAVLFIEIVLNILTYNTMMLIIYLAILFYSLLIAKDFFIKRLLDKSPILFLITHQLIIPLLLFYAVAGNNYSFETFMQHYKALLSLIAGVWMLFLYFEIARKTRLKNKEWLHDDSYSSVWGMKRTVMVLSILLIVSALLLNTAMAISNLSLWVFVVINSCFFFALIKLILFLYKSEKKKSGSLEKSAYLLIVSISLIFILLFIIIKP